MELVVIFLVVLVLFGPKKLPEIARMIGKTIDQLRNASQDFKDEIMKIEDDVKKEIRNVATGEVDAEETDSHTIEIDEDCSVCESTGGQHDDCSAPESSDSEPEVKAMEDGGRTSEDDKELAG